MKIEKFTIGYFEVNNYLVWEETSRNALLIDAGEDPGPILEKIKRLGLTLVYLVNTHGHGDHIAGNARILKETSAKLLIHREDAPFLEDPNLNLSSFLGFALHSPAAGEYLQEGRPLKLGRLTFQVLHTPGHTPGHVCLVCNGHAFVGDVIFRRGVGRTDFPYGSAKKLAESIRNKIFTLPQETILYPGHGPATTVRDEKFSNPFVSF